MKQPKCANKKQCNENGCNSETGKDPWYCELCFWMKRMDKQKVIEIVEEQYADIVNVAKHAWKRKLNKIKLNPKTGLKLKKTNTN